MAAVFGTTSVLVLVATLASLSESWTSCDAQTARIHSHT